MPKQSKPKTVKVKDIFGKCCRVYEEELLNSAKRSVDARFKSGEELTTFGRARGYVRLLIGQYEREVFYVLWLNSQHRVIKHGVLFQGTLSSGAVYPREVVKDALSCNAAAVIFAHNHPSGDSEPSKADISLTRELKRALALIDVQTLDHFIVGNTVSSLAELGLM